MTSDTGSPLQTISLNTIFHANDFSSNPDIAFAHALKLAWGASAKLTLFHVNEGLDELNWQEFPSVRATLAKWDLPSHEHSIDHRPHSKIDVEKILYRGKDPSDSILEHLDRHPADLLVLATHQLGGRPFFHSVSEPVARKSKIMTLFVPFSTDGFVSPENGTLTLQNILIPIDHDPQPPVALQAITTLINTLGCVNTSVTVLYIGDEQEMPECDQSQRTNGTWNYIVRSGDVVEEILQVEQELAADLIVMPTQGHQGFLDALRGSTTEQIVRKARCPVLAVPAE
ncbi:universal stress protein [Candidatus Nitrospira salsa]|nr:MAG: hypothetical protein NPIRA04_01740 [Nitrospirales bacterium]